MKVTLSNAFQNKEATHYDLSVGADWLAGGTSNGKLRKYYYDNKHIKTGRMDTRDFPNNFGIEPIIECITYELGTALGVDIADEKLGVAKISYKDKFVYTLVNVSNDFRANDVSLMELQDYNRLVEKQNQINTIDNIITICGKDAVLDMMLFDLIIMNEDRHNRNIAMLVFGDELVLSPIYDNGYSLLYDDVKRIKEYKRCARNTMCNAPIYGNTFKSLENMIKNATQNIMIPDVNVKQIVDKCEGTYKTFAAKYELNNIPLTEEWWESIISFIDWRLDYVKNLQADE